MSDFQHKPNRGSLFANDKREKENSPTHKGTLNVDGVEYWISGWVEESKRGRRYFSLSVKRKQQQRRQQSQEPPPGDFDDSVPF